MDKILITNISECQKKYNDIADILDKMMADNVDPLYIIGMLEHLKSSILKIAYTE